jgi:hypothetical protein
MRNGTRHDLTASTKLASRAAIETDRPLSPVRAFVVQFREDGASRRTRFAGRIEHTVSGRAARFHSQKELIDFFVRVLSEFPAGRPDGSATTNQPNGGIP